MCASHNYVFLCIQQGELVMVVESFMMEKIILQSLRSVLTVVYFTGNEGSEFQRVRESRAR